MRRPTLAPVVIVLAVLVLLFAGYAATYFAMLKGRRTWPDVVSRQDRMIPYYHLRSRWVENVLWPVHQIDRAMRPGYWRPVPVDVPEPPPPQVEE